MLKRSFAPNVDSVCTSVALLLLRIWVGLVMLPHGFMKIQNFDKMSGQMMNFLGLGPTLSLSLVIFAEVGCSILLVLGLLSRFAALVLSINMAVAFFVAHKASLTGEHNGELAFIYLAAYIALLLAGPGKLSLDAKLFGEGKQAPAEPAATP